MGISYNLEIIVRLLLAVVAGGVIGLERKQKGKPAGFITNILVCVGAASIALIQDMNFRRGVELILTQPELESLVKVDPGRLTAQVISGIGFLGGGVIMQSKEKIKGITTAATLWVVAGLGIAIGMGYYFMAIAATTIIIAVLLYMKRMEITYIDKKQIKKLYMVRYDTDEAREYFYKLLKEYRIKIVQKKLIGEIIDENTTELKYVYHLTLPQFADLKVFLEALKNHEDISEARQV